MGLYDIRNKTNAQTSVVDSIYYHKNFNITTLRNDIALLRLKTPINLMDNVNILPQDKKDYQGSSK